MAITNIWCRREAQLGLTFDNGVDISIIWGLGSYSDNHDMLNPKYQDEDGHPDFRRRDFDSRTMEIYCRTSPAFAKWLERKYGDNPAGYVPAAELPKIIAEAGKEKYGTK